MADRRPVALRTDTTPARLQEMPAGDLLPADVLNNALSLLLQGLLTNTSTAVTATDTVLQALGKLQAQVTLRAPLASPALTGTPTVPTAADGTSTTQAASTAFVQGAVGGALSKAVTGGTVTLTAAEASNALIMLTGTLTSNLSLVFPAAVRRLWTIRNATAGAFTVTCKLATGTGASVAQGKKNIVTTDGTNFYDALDDFHDVALTGAPSAPTAAAGTNNTQVATTEFAQTAATAAMDRANHTGPLNWARATYGGTANVITLAPVFSRDSYAAGDEFRFRASAANTGATTINVGGLGAKAAVTVTGAVLPAGYIRTDVDTVCVYDGTRFVVSREIESGATAQGDYTRFADGTLICKRTYTENATVAAGTGYAPDFAFSAAFVVPPYVDANIAFFEGANATGAQLYSNTFGYHAGAPRMSVLNTGRRPAETHPSFTVGAYSASSIQVAMTAIGRWYA